MVKEYKIRVRGGQLAARYETASPNAQTILFLNGLGRPSSDFKFLAKKFLEKQFSVLSFDNRGIGDSQNDLDFYSMADLSEDIGAVLDACNIDTCHLVGLSMGGMMAQNFSAVYPQRVDKLVLVGSASSAKGLGSGRLHTLKTKFEFTEAFQSYVAQDFYQKNRVLCDSIARDLEKKYQNPLYRKAVEQQEAAIQTLPDDILSKSSFAKPLLIIHGEEDQIIFKGASEKIKSQLPSAELILYPKVGHLILIEAGKSLIEDVLAFLSPP